MLPVLIRPDQIADPELQSTWAYYGARQLLDMIGLSYTEAPSRGGQASLPVPAQAADQYDTGLVIDPAAGQICVNCRPEAADYGPVWPILRVELEAKLPALGFPAPLGDGLAEEVVGSQADSLPLFGGVRDVKGDAAWGALGYVEAKFGEQGPLLVVQETGPDAFRITLNAPVFETIGLYLSRFSWAGNPGFKSFVRYIDALWAALQDRWGRRPVVGDYQDIFTAILRRCYRKLGLVMATKWYHPAIDGEIKLNGMLLTHDVDSVYGEPRFRGQAEQSGNPHFNFPKWRELEDRFGIKSAFYFFSPAPSREYWLPAPSYLVTEEPVLRAARELAESGWEIAPHELGHRTPAEVADEVAYFEQVTGCKPPGTRNHHLKHYPDSLKYKAAAGLLYDSTWYAEQTDILFLCGTALPYAPLDTATGEPLDIWEFAFVIEDGIVTGGYGAGTERDTRQAVADGARGLDLIIAKNGYACFNWHQRVFALRTRLQQEPDNWVTILEGLLEHYQANARGWWNPLPGELAAFWSRRQAVQVESRAGEILVSNQGDGDCADFVLALHCDAPPLSGAQQVPQRGVFCLAAGVAAGREQTFELDR